MKRLVLAVSFGAFAFAFGCGGDDDGGDPDAMTGNQGFVTPTETTLAWEEVNGVWTEMGAADWSCLNTPSDDVATTVDINLTGVVEDFQTGNPVPDALNQVFPGADIGNIIGMGTADEDANYSMTLPMGHARYGFLTTVDGTLPTYLLNQYFDPDTADQSLTLNSVSNLTANALPAFIGVTRTQGLGILAGAMRDCQDREVSGTIATVSGTSGAPDHLDGAQTYYFSAGSTSLPVRHSQASTTNSDGLFMVIELPLTTTAYMQVWGFVDDADLADGEPTLLAELPSPVEADTIITASIEPLRN